MNYRDPQLIETLAGEYALGTLHGAARRRFEALRRERDDVDREATWWEESLSAWALHVPPVAPPKRVWKGIARRIDARRSQPMDSRPWLGIAASVLFVGLMSLFLLRPDDIPREPVPHQVAVIQDEDHAALWRISVLDEGLDVRHIAADAPGPNQDYELWLLTDDGPVSLGLLPQTGERRLSLPEALLRQVQTGGAVAVSVEPEGGSPEPVPTGPVIAVAPLVAA